MARSIRTGILPVLFGFVFFTQLAHAAMQPRDQNPVWHRSSSMTELVSFLNQWLDANSAYRSVERNAAIRFVDDGDGLANVVENARDSLRTRGLYEPETATIYLVRPWRADRAMDVSVLLHELVHHRQQSARHWYCPGAQETDAYALQQTWLAERGVELRLNRIAIVLEAGCSKRDIHPASMTRH